MNKNVPPADPSVWVQNLMLRLQKKHAKTFFKTLKTFSKSIKTFLKRCQYFFWELPEPENILPLKPFKHGT